MRLPRVQFSLARLMFSVLLIAASLEGFRWLYFSDPQSILWLPALLTATTCLGTAIGVPFHRIRAGAIFGFVIPVIIVMAALALFVAYISVIGSKQLG